jgi:XisI protein
MDKLKRNKQLVRELTEEVGKMGDFSSKSIDTQLITDDEHGHYLLYFNGWRTPESRTYGCFLHIDVAPDGQVWLQYDGTDLVIAQMLQEKGIPKNEIVLGFQAPFKRPLLDYATG